MYFPKLLKHIPSTEIKLTPLTLSKPRLTSTFGFGFLRGGEIIWLSISIIVHYSTHGEKVG